ncbi:hypothetical protein [Streptomyces carpinensis]|nr:hypothetical protein [Streptomyces carpinensis]
MRPVRASAVALAASALPGLAAPAAGNDGELVATVTQQSQTATQPV